MGFLKQISKDLSYETSFTRLFLDVSTGLIDKSEIPDPFKKRMLNFMEKPKSGFKYLNDLGVPIL